jgi:hypothetical protein
MFLIVALASMVIFGILSIVMIPIFYLLMRNAVHRCSRCLQKMGEKRCFGLPNNFSDEVWHALIQAFRYGSLD